MNLKRMSALFLCLLMLFTICSCKKKKPDNSTITPGGVQLDPNQGSYVDPNQGNGTPSQGVSIPGWGTITIPANKTDVTVDFYNPEQNAGLYYLTFELRLPDANGGYEVLYKSGLIQAGNHIQKITLSHGLAEGIYNAVIFVQPYRIDGITPTNNLETQTVLVVK